MPRIANCCFLMCLLQSSIAHASVVGYHYTGNVTFVFPVFPPNSPPFDITVPSTADVSGSFWYDTDVLGSPGDVESTEYYLQEHYLTLNFTAPAFGGLSASTFGYRMVVSNDLSGGPTPVDRVSFVFAANLGLHSAWTVNSGNQDDGLIRLNFEAGAAARADKSVPADLSFASLPQPGQLFADTSIGNIDIVFAIQTLTPASPEEEAPPPVPEPSTLILLMLGLALSGAYRLVKRHI